MMTTNGSGHEMPEFETTHGFDDDTPRVLSIDIDPPIEHNGKSYSVMNLEEPTGRQIERAESELAPGVNVHTLRKYQFALVSQASGLPRAVVEQMKISQIKKAADFLAPFIAAGPETGGI